MELGVFDRIIILNILPKEGDIFTIRIVRELREALSFSEEENENLAFRTENGSVLWKSDAEKPKEIDIGLKASEIIRERLNKLNDEKKLSEEHLPIWDKFIS